MSVVLIYLDGTRKHQCNQFKFEHDEIDLASYDSPHASIQDRYSLKKAPKELIKKKPDLMIIKIIVSNNESKMTKKSLLLISFKGQLKYFREKIDKRINKNSSI